VREEVAAQLLRLNSEFYQSLAGPFGQTRARLQPGVLRAMRGLGLGAAVLDLGCGPGTLAQELARRGHHGGYLGVDASEALLAQAMARALPPEFRFLHADITQPNWLDDVSRGFDVIFAFAVLHHIPREVRRLQLVRHLRSLLRVGGAVTLSTWDFLASERMRDRIQPWERVGLTAQDVDPGDHLIDWRRGGTGLRYVHHFDEDELRRLAAEAGFEVREVWRSDGEGGRLGLYQRWEIAQRWP
jgi:2-polyprenyl-3-methyl-5-hydroxy-6-metoxy-1,4-benzoquinol methylase